MQFLNQAGAAVNWAHLVIFGTLETGCEVWRTLRFSIAMPGNSKIARKHYEYLSILKNFISFSRLARKFLAWWLQGPDTGRDPGRLRWYKCFHVSMFPCLQRILTRTTNPRHTFGLNPHITRIPCQQCSHNHRILQFWVMANATGETSAMAEGVTQGASWGVLANESWQLGTGHRYRNAPTAKAVSQAEQ